MHRSNLQRESFYADDCKKEEESYGQKGRSEEARAQDREKEEEGHEAQGLKEEIGSKKGKKAGAQEGQT